MKNTHLSRSAPTRLLALFPLCLAAHTASADITVSYDSPLVPAGLRPGDSFHLVFLTSTKVQRDLLDGSDDGSDDSTIAQWDAHVNSVADAAAETAIGSVNWFAVVSLDNLSDGNPGTAAKDHAVVSAPVYRTDGALVANDMADLWDGSLAVTINLDEDANPVSGWAWAGGPSYAGDGTIGSQPVGNGTNSATRGDTSVTTVHWHGHGGHLVGKPDGSEHVYALSERITIEVPPDGDADGLPDWYELAHTDPSSDTALNPGDDLDDDGLTNLEEYEVAIPTDPNDPDSDDDGLLDGPSITLNNSDPRYAAWASAGISYSDNGGDRTFRGEVTMGTIQYDPDTDDDGLLDGPESNTGTWMNALNTGTDPLDPDSDDDGLLDGAETNTGIYVDETNTGTHPLLVDTDSDGAGDWYELTASFTDPSDQADSPGIPYPLPDPDIGTPPATDKPVKVFILSGQSNMVGIGYVNGPKPGSLDAITKVDGKFPNLLDDSGEYLPRNDVWYEGVVTAAAKKWLAPGCGNGANGMGPELGFGQIMGWHHDEPVLIIKASQGNRGIGWDILPPGSTQYDWSNGKTYPGYGESPQDWLTASESEAPAGWYAGKQYDDYFKHESDMGARAWASGVSYPANCQVTHNGWTYISALAHTSEVANEPQVDGGSNPIASAEWNVYSIENVADVLDNFDTKFPDWAAQGFEIAGYAWFQGHWDQSEPYASKYEENLTQLINQTRSYFENRYPGKVTPSAPFAVATIGFGGEPFAEGTPSRKVYDAQLAVGDPAEHPEFAGNVKSVDTLGYWRELDESPGNQGYHYNNNAETYMLIGDALGRAMLDLLDDETPPFPDPTSFLIAPTAVDATTVGMVAATATDSSPPVEYYFENTTNGDNSGWTTSTSWNNTGLAPGSYSYRVKARDAVGNETGWSDPASASPGSDGTTPTPDPMSFAIPPYALGDTSITMRAATALDISGVEYYFDCLTPGGHDSGWQDSPEYTDTGLTQGTEYSYTVQARDKSAGQNTTAVSIAVAATTTQPDIFPPSPNPAGFSIAPTADSGSAISMTAVTGVDASGPVEYLFTETSGNPGGDDSGWQTSPSYTDEGLSGETSYTYTVTMRDNLGNTGTASPGASATTLVAADGYEIAADSPLVPGGLGPGDSFQLVFVTSSTIQRDLLDGVDDGSDDARAVDWDNHVNAVADGSTLADVPDIVWFAIVSVDNQSDGNPGVAAADHAVVTHAVYRTDGAQVATGFTDMWDGSLINPITIDEDGNPGPAWAWSGGPSYSANGTIGSQSLGNGKNSATRGDVSEATSHWFGHGGHMSRGPDSSEAVYALSEVITVAGAGGGNDFSDWIAAYNVGAQTGIDDDPDGDGVESGVENFFGTAPDAFSQGLVSGTVDAGANSFTFTHPLNATPADDLTATYRWSTDLQAFHDDGASSGGTTVAFVQGTPVDGMVEVTATVTGASTGKLFVQVQVTQN